MIHLSGRRPGGPRHSRVAAPEPDDRTEVNGDRAIVVDHYRARWAPPANQRPTGGPVPWIDGDPHPWRAEVRRGRTGWRLWSVTIPPWCGTYSRCGNGTRAGRVAEPVAVAG